MSSASFTVTAPPTLSVAGSMKEGFPLTAAITGPLDSNDRVRIDTLGQAEICAACTDPAVNKPAGPNVTFANTPKAGTYQVRVLRRDQTVALQTITIDPLPKATLTLWRVRDLSPTAGCTALWSNAFGHYSTILDSELVWLVDYNWIDGIKVLTDAGRAKHLNPASACPVNTAEPIPYDLAEFSTPAWWAKALYVTVSGYTPLAGDNVVYGPGPGGTPIVTGTNVWFTPASLALGNGDSHVTFSYRTTVNGFPVIIGQLATIIRRTAVIGLPVCVVSAETAIALTKSTALPSDSWTTVGDCSNPIIMFLVPGTGEELPNQRNPDGTPKANDDPTRNNPTNPNAPPKPSVSQAPPVGAHPLTDGVITDLKLSTDLSCVASSSSPSGALLVAPNGSDCLLVLPVAMPEGWKFLDASDPVDCLVALNGVLTMARPCAGESYFSASGEVGLAFPLRPYRTSGSCLAVSVSKVPIFETCRVNASDNKTVPDQLWYDPPNPNPERWLGNDLAIFGDDGTFGPPVPYQFAQSGLKDDRRVYEVVVKGRCTSVAGGNAGCEPDIEAIVIRNGFERLVGAYKPVDEDVEDTEYIDITKSVFNKIATKEDRYIRKNLGFSSLTMPLRPLRARFVLEGGSIPAAERLYFSDCRCDLSEGIQEDPWGQFVIDSLIGLGVEALAAKAAPIIWAAVSNRVVNEVGAASLAPVAKVVNAAVRAEAKVAAGTMTALERTSLGDAFEAQCIGVLEAEGKTVAQKASVLIRLNKSVRGRGGKKVDQLSILWANLQRSRVREDDSE